MNRGLTTSALSLRRSRRRYGSLDKATRMLLSGPADLPGRAARWSVNVLVAIGAALMVWSGAIHLELWSGGFRYIAAIGPLFLAQGVGSIVVAVAVVLVRRLVLLAAGAVVMVATAGGLLLSAWVGLFGYQENLEVPYARSSLVVEFASAAALLAAAVVLLVRRPGDPARTSARG